MHSRAAAAQVVVVHAGKVVVDEGGAVEKFDGQGGRKGVFFVGSATFGGGDAENGTNPFASVKDGVFDGTV